LANQALEFARLGGFILFYIFHQNRSNIVPQGAQFNKIAAPSGVAILLVLCGVKKHAGGMFREESKPD
jgi:hypothetical protein